MVTWATIGLWVLWFLVLIGISAFRRVTKFTPTVTGAEKALKHLEEWAKWMSGIQVAALGGLGFLVFNKDNGNLLIKVKEQAWFASWSFLFLGFGLFCSAWILSALPSLAVRVYSVEEKRSASFDIYEQGIFGWCWVKVGYLLTLQHWIWAMGLGCLGVLVFLKLFP